LSTAGFLILEHKAEKEDGPQSTEDIDRLKVWLLPTVEWLIFLTIVLWFVLIALGL